MRLTGPAEIFQPVSQYASILYVHSTFPGLENCNHIIRGILNSFFSSIFGSGLISYPMSYLVKSNISPIMENTTNTPTQEGKFIHIEGHNINRRYRR